MICLDTHVVLWLYEGSTKLLSAKARRLIEENDLLISPAVRLEIEYLHETGRLARPAHEILGELQVSVGLRIFDVSFGAVIEKAMTIHWTRDPFDRLIVATALCAGTPLLTRDPTIRKNMKIAVWS